MHRREVIRLLSIVLESPHVLAAKDAPDPGQPRAGEVAVRVLRVGVCGTDLHAYAGRQPFMAYPVIPGHELAVEVIAIGPQADPASTGDEGRRADPDAPVPPSAGEAAPLRVGDRCTVVPYLHDGTCYACRRGRENCCATLSVLGVHTDGGLRETMHLPASLLVPANDVDVDALAVVEMLAVGAHAAERARIGADDDVVVVGAGPIGLATAAFARQGARRFAMIEARSDRRAFADGLGLGSVLSGGADVDVEAQLRNEFGGELPTVVIDATGNAASMQAAPQLAARGGRVVFVGHTKERLTFENPLLHGHELTLATSRNATRRDFETVLADLRSGAVDPRPWITHRVDPHELVAQLPAWSRGEGGVVKALTVLA